MVAQIQQHAEVDCRHGPARPGTRHRDRNLLPHRDAEPLPVQPLVLAARAGQPGLGLPHHPGPPRRHRHCDDPAHLREAVVGVSEPVPVAADQVRQECARARQRRHPGVGDAGATVHRFLQRPELVPVQVGLRRRPPLPGLRRGRLGPAAHGGQAPRHRLRAPDEGRRRGRSHRDPVAREPRGAQQTPGICRHR